MRILFKNARLILPTGIYDGEVLVDGSTISKVAVKERITENADRTIDVQGMYLSPGFIEMHCHGGGGHDFTDGTLEAVYGACSKHMEHGTTSILPTTITGSREDLLDVVDLFNTVELKKDGLPEIIGLHMEGPYFAYNQRGAQAVQFLRDPDPAEYLAVLDRTDRIKRWSFAIELPGSDGLLDELAKRNILASVAHSDATCQQVFRAYDKGVRMLTHFYSCMSSVVRVNAYRVAGIVEAGYLLDDMYVEAIADGCHLPAELLQLIYKVKGPDRICLVSDSMRAAGMPDGVYALGAKKDGHFCIKEDGVGKLPDRSAFAGSVATSDRLVRTFHSLTDAPLYQVVKMASFTPARFLGIADRKGSIREGLDADLVIFDEDINVSMVMCRGQITKG